MICGWPVILQVPDLLRQVTCGNGSVWIRIRIFEIEYLQVRIWINPWVNSWCALASLPTLAHRVTSQSHLHIHFHDIIHLNHSNSRPIILRLRKQWFHPSKMMELGVSPQVISFTWNINIFHINTTWKKEMIWGCWRKWNQAQDDERWQWTFHLNHMTLSSFFLRLLYLYYMCVHMSKIHFIFKSPFSYSRPMWDILTSTPHHRLKTCFTPSCPPTSLRHLPLLFFHAHPQPLTSHSSHPFRIFILSHICYDIYTDIPSFSDTHQSIISPWHQHRLLFNITLQIYKISFKIHSKKPLNAVSQNF